MGYGWNTSHPITISKKSIILIYHYLHVVLVILAKAPVYKLRLGRPSRLPSVFINFKMDPCLCPLPKNILFLCLQVRTLDIQLHLDVCSGIHLNIHHSPTLHPYPSLSNDLLPHPANSAPCHFPQSPPV